MTPQFDAIGVVVLDMGASLGFYRLLGLEFPAGADEEQHVEATLPNGLRIMFDAVEMIQSIDPTWTAPSGGPRISLAFKCEDPAEVDRVYGQLVDAGYEAHKAPWDAFWGQRYALMRDPDGNSVDLFAPLP